MTPEFWMGIVGIAGTVLAVAITSLVHLKSEKLRQHAQINDKILDRSLEAHLNFEKIVCRLNNASSMLLRNEHGEQYTLIYPVMFEDRKTYTEFHRAWVDAVHEIGMWNSENLRIEHVLVTNYLYELQKYIVKSSDEQLRRLGYIVGLDFTDMAKRINSELHIFLTCGAYEIRKNSFGNKGISNTKKIPNYLNESSLQTNKYEIEAIYQ